MRSLFADRNFRSCSPAVARKAFRSRLASAASSPRALLMLMAGLLPRSSAASSEARLSLSPGVRMLTVSRSRFLRGVLQIGAHALAQEHRVMSLEHPLAGSVPHGAGSLVGFKLVDGRVIG